MWPFFSLRKYHLLICKQIAVQSVFRWISNWKKIFLVNYSQTMISILSLLLFHTQNHFAFHFFLPREKQRMVGKMADFFGEGFLKSCLRGVSCSLGWITPTNCLHGVSWWSHKSCWCCAFSYWTANSFNTLHNTKTVVLSPWLTKMHSNLKLAELCCLVQELKELWGFLWGAAQYQNPGSLSEDTFKCKCTILRKKAPISCVAMLRRGEGPMDIYLQWQGRLNCNKG